ncbi:unnamed protein product [Vicia faba]|uniref:Uncharacterized protein n=1 Tax=Vicia faba TaxID=3906 RepID=A0AAV0YWZ5_VICFA|nr:unnamed protein product [Vicia faba]
MSREAYRAVIGDGSDGFNVDNELNEDFYIENEECLEELGDNLLSTLHHLLLDLWFHFGQAFWTAKIVKRLFADWFLCRFWSEVAASLGQDWGTIGQHSRDWFFGILQQHNLECSIMESGEIWVKIEARFG